MHTTAKPATGLPWWYSLA